MINILLGMVVALILCSPLIAMVIKREKLKKELRKAGIPIPPT